MKKTAKPLITLFFIIALCASASVLFACEPKEKINKYAYQTESFAYIEEHNDSQYRYEAYKTSQMYADYYFVNTVPKIERDTFVTYTEKALRLLDPQKRLTLYAAYQFDSRAVSAKNSVYLTQKDYKNFNSVCFLLQGLYGETVNYGLLYGLGARLCGELNWIAPQQTKTDNEIKEFLSDRENRYILDLTYGVFDAKFSSQAQTEFAKSIALSLAGYINANCGTDIYKQLFAANRTFDPAFDTLFYPIVNAYLDTLSVENVSIDRAVIRYALYLPQYPVRFSTFSCDYFVDKDWVDGSSIYFVATDFGVGFGYTLVKDFLLGCESFLAKVRDFFSYEGDKKPMVMLEEIDHRYGGYASPKGFIVLRVMNSLTHEYAHIITFDLYGDFYYAWDGAHWIPEGAAGYCDFEFNDFSIAWFKYVFENQHILQTEKDKEVFLMCKNIFADDFSMKNFVYCYTYLAYRDYGKLPLFGFDMDYDDIQAYYNTATALSYWIIDNYGLEKYLQLYASRCNYQQVLGKTEEQIMTDFVTFILELQEV